MDKDEITIVVKSTDMTPDQVEAKTMVMHRVMLQNKRGEPNMMAIAKMLKDELDSQEDSPCWNVVVGKLFGVSFKHKAKTLAYVRVGQFSMMIWRIV